MASFRVMVSRVLLLVAALVSWPIHAQPDPNKVLRWAFEIAETGFDPPQTSDWYSAYVFANIFDTPLTYDYLARPVKLKPNVLEAMPDVSPDGLVYTLKFRKGIYFADDAAFNGQKRELVAADLAYSMKRLFDPKTRSPNLSYLDGKIAGMEKVRQRQRDSGVFDYDMPVEGFELVDRYTLRIKLVAPDYNFLYILAYNGACAIVAREVVEKYATDIMAHPVGTGPYKLESWKRSSKTVLVANPGFRQEYWEAEPNVDDAKGQEIAKKMRGKRLPMIGRIEFYVIEETQPRWLSFRNMQHDYIDRVHPDFINQAYPNNKLAKDLEKLGVQVSRTAAMEVTYAYFAMENPVVGGYTPDKVALRRAIGMGYNAPEEIAINRKGQAVAVHTPIGPGAFGYEPDFRSRATEYDPAAARALLDVFGYKDRDGDGYRENPDGSRLEILMSSTPTLRDRQLDEGWKKSMEAIGIRISFPKAQWPDLLKESLAGKLMSWRLAWGAVYPDADAFYLMLFGPNAGQANHARFKNDEFDRLYLKARMTPPGEERLAMYRQMNRIFLSLAPWRLGVARMDTDLTHAWMIGYQRHPTLRGVWKMVDMDLDVQRKVRKE
ncbi:MAG: bicyclomycin resistance protein [Rhodocyclaceae bacterium]|nr:bicyclomycin resistance protein [Rhodocyclaceae bacterium]